MATDLFDRVAVIDVDTHLTEPPDTWTARMPAALHDVVPHIERIDGNDVWMAARRAPRRTRLLLDGRVRRRHAGVDPEDVRRDPRRDVRRRRRASRSSTREGIDAAGALPERRRVRQRLLPAPRRPRARRRSACAAYNDFLTDWCSADPDRLLAVTALPFWDVDLAIAELQRVHRARPPGGELLQPAAGLRPAAARAPALGPGVGGRAGGRRLGELPRRRRFDGHAVRRRPPAWAG